MQLKEESFVNLIIVVLLLAPSVIGAISLAVLRPWRSVQDAEPPNPMMTITSREGGGQLRIMYSHDCRLFLVDPNSARWEAHPGTELVMGDVRSWEINTDRITLIEEGFAESDDH